jgi:maltooligosyltrehalose trehalohydrolase
LIDDSAAGCVSMPWADDFHHAVRRHIAGDAHGYYRDYTGTADEIACTLREGWLVTERRGTNPTGVPMERFVACLQNHDQVGNRASGDRLHHAVDAATWRAASVLLLMAPMTPLLFMGQEWAANTPFQFFTDMESALGADITIGRRLEFADFPEFSDPQSRDAIPDPQAQSTFDASRLRWEERQMDGHRESLNLYSALISLRRAHAALGGSEDCTGDAVASDRHSIVLGRRGPGAAFWIVVRLSGEGTVDVPLSHVADVILTSEDILFAPDPQPPSIEWTPSGAKIHFRRPGAVILSAGAT